MYTTAFSCRFEMVHGQICGFDSLAQSSFQIPAALVPAPPAPSPAASKKWTLWNAPSFPLRYMDGPHTLLVLHGSARVYRCRVTSAMGMTSIVLTPRLPPHTPRPQRAPTGWGVVRICERVLHSHSVFYNDRQREYDKRGDGGMREKGDG
ncbi:hypothetical protein B0H13DRAFT_595763 [Mycena leptocephala]|nr:hypothetical protein B0H13DRAFT_595763 [Mycena leptocephala]